jgi:RNA polymerase sigma factor (sigma-70 family)
MKSLLGHLRRAALLRDGGGLTDGQLLESFLSGRENAAFEALVRRHGPMVLGVCRRVLGHVQDAEDAFQATFLVLVRKADSVRPRELVGNWLYGVAYRTALKARSARQRAKERQVEDMDRPETLVEEGWQDLLPLLDRELNRLPEKYRVPVVLCELEGRSRKEVARFLKLPEGTVSSRLAAARKMLARRLSRHRPALSAVALGALLADGAVAQLPTPTLVAATVKVVTPVAGGVSARVAVLAEGVMKVMVLTKLKIFTAVLLAAAIVGGAAGRFVWYPSGSADQAVPEHDRAGDVGAVQMADPEPLGVTVRAQADRVRVNQPFEVQLRVVNRLESSQSFRVMSCSWYEHWRSDNPRVSWNDWPCHKNIPQTVKLEPGQAYAKALPMRVTAGAPAGETPFRLGFAPLDGKRTYWSNEITLWVEQEAPR